MALICQHDIKRRHLHCIFVLPPGVTLECFRTTLHQALDREPFAHREQRVEPAKDAAASIAYDLNDKKTLTGSALLYVYPIPHNPPDRRTQ
jgi:hypothetical protein